MLTQITPRLQKTDPLRCIVWRISPLARLPSLQRVAATQSQLRCGTRLRRRMLTRRWLCSSNAVGCFRSRAQWCIRFRQSARLSFLGLSILSPAARARRCAHGSPSSGTAQAGPSARCPPTPFILDLLICGPLPRLGPTTFKELEGGASTVERAETEILSYRLPPACRR